MSGNPDYTLYVAIDTTQLNRVTTNLETMFSNASRKLSMASSQTSSNSNPAAKQLLKIQSDIAEYQRKVYAAQAMRDFKAMDALGKEVRELNVKIGKLNSGVSTGSSAKKVLPTGTGGSPLAEALSGQQQFLGTSIGVNYGERQATGFFARLSAMFQRVMGTTTTPSNQAANRANEFSSMSNTASILTRNMTKQTNMFQRMIDGISSISKSSLALVGIGAGVASLVALFTESSPLLKSVLRLLNLGVMMIFRPFATLIANILLPFAPILIRAGIAFNQFMMPYVQKYGKVIGENLANLLTDPAKFFATTAVAIGGAVAMSLAANGFLGGRGGGPSGTPGFVFPDCIEICNQSSGTLSQGIGQSVGSSLKNMLPLAVTAVGMGVGFELLSAKLDNISSKIDRLNDGINTSVGSLAPKLDSLFVGVVNGFTNLGISAARIVSAVNDVPEKIVTGLSASFNLLETSIITMSQQLTIINNNLNGLSTQLTTLDKDLTTLNTSTITVNDSIRALDNTLITNHNLYNSPAGPPKPQPSPFDIINTANQLAPKLAPEIMFRAGNNPTIPLPTIISTYGSSDGSGSSGYGIDISSGAIVQGGSVPSVGASASSGSSDSSGRNSSGSSSDSGGHIDTSSGAIVSNSSNSYSGGSFGAAAHLSASQNPFGFAKGGILREPVKGKGQITGREYKFAENGPEAFLGSGSNSRVATGNTTPTVNNYNYYATFQITGTPSVSDLEKLKSTVMGWLQQSRSKGGTI